MDFAGFRRGLQEEFNSWALPKRIVNEFHQRILQELPRVKPIDCRRIGGKIVYPVTIHDQMNPGSYYRFLLVLGMDDARFWIVNIRGFAYGSDGHLIWTAPLD